MLELFNIGVIWSKSNQLYENKLPTPVFIHPICILCTKQCLHLDRKQLHQKRSNDSNA